MGHGGHLAHAVALLDDHVELLGGAVVQLDSQRGGPGQDDLEGGQVILGDGRVARQAQDDGGHQMGTGDLRCTGWIERAKRRSKERRPASSRV